MKSKLVLKPLYTYKRESNGINIHFLPKTISLYVCILYKCEYIYHPVISAHPWDYSFLKQYRGGGEREICLDDAALQLSKIPCINQKILGLLLCWKWLKRFLHPVDLSVYPISQLIWNPTDVERRRIYDIVNVLEGVGVVERKAKNKYTWFGLSRLQQTLGNKLKWTTLPPMSVSSSPAYKGFLQLCWRKMQERKPRKFRYLLKWLRIFIY